MEENEKYMKDALREAIQAGAEDEVPIGAVIVCRGRIIGKGHNMTERLNDPTAHAEMERRHQPLRWAIRAWGVFALRILPLSPHG
ncbi:MAG: nucleoside deaminase, partial [Bacteroidales bacterium]|nr:nucleoside deaminase [Bacteroidales bacterium]